MLKEHKHLSRLKDQAVLSPQPIDDIQYNVKTGSENEQHLIVFRCPQEKGVTLKELATLAKKASLES